MLLGVFGKRAGTGVGYRKSNPKGNLGVDQGGENRTGYKCMRIGVTMLGMGGRGRDIAIPTVF